MKTPGIIRQVEAYWEGLRAYGDLPTRDQIDPRGLDSALDYAFLLDVSHTGECVFKLGGQRLGDILGAPLEHVPFAALFSQAVQPQVRSALRSVYTDPAMLRAQIISQEGVMRPLVEANLLLLPLKGPDATVSQALGVLHFEDALGRSPRQFNQFMPSLTRLVLSESLTPKYLDKIPMGMAEASSEFTYEKRRTEQSVRPNLKVIDGGLK